MNVVDSRVPLAKLPRGRRGVVSEIQGGAGMRSRLLSMGLNVGDEIEVLDGGRGAMIVCCGHTRLAIGCGMSTRIFIDVCCEGC